MNDIGTRIEKVINELNIKKTNFAEKIMVDQSYVTQLTKGKRNPSSRIITTICREFNVNEEWLRTGEGEMFINLTEDDFLKAATTLSNDVFVRGLIIEYSKLDENNKQLFRNFIQNLSDNMRGQETTQHDLANLD